MSPASTSFEAWLDVACAQQDYIWFVAMVAACGVLLAWWRHPQKASQSWVAWGAVMTFLHCGAGIATFIAPNIERVNPVPGAPPPHILADMFMGATAGLWLAGWWWQLTQSKPGWRWPRWIGVGLLAGICWLRKDYPATGGWTLAIVATLLLAVALRSQRRWLAAGAILLVAALWLSPWGPTAATQRVLLRWRDWSILSVICAALLAAAQLATLRDLLEEILSALPTERRRKLLASSRPFVFAAAAWLVAGLFMAAIAARNTRHNFETAALTRVVTAAAMIDPAGLEEILGPKFRPVASGRFSTKDDSGQSVSLFRTESATRDKLVPVMAQLKRFFQLNPDLTYVLIAKPYEDKLFIAVPMAQSASNSGIVYPIRTLIPADQEHWANQTPHLEIGTPTDGTMFMARAPILSAAGQPLGWLQFDFGIGLWAAAQAQARLLTFVVVTMGLGLVVLLFLRQWREHDREAALRTAAAADMANRMKTQFLANVSHEFRTPLQSILGYAELLHGHIRGEVEQARLAALRQHGELLIRLVNDLIDLGMLESGAFRLVEKTFAPGRLVAEVTDSLRPRAEAKGLKLECQVDPALPAWAVSDPERLRQVLLNVIGNAVKYTDCGRIDVQLTQQSYDHDHHYVELAVRDTGPGIPPAEQHRLFEPFSRLANAERKEGSGLGLALTAGLCRRLGGDLTVESDGATGSIFRTVLKLRPGAAPATRATLERDALAGWRILVADDNALVRELFVAYLSELGAECIVAADGHAAVAYATDARLRAIVLDLAMPGLDGTQVARQVRAAGGRQRIIGVSAHGGGVERAEALAAGMDDFLLKPIDLPALAAALHPTATPPATSDFWALRRDEWESALRRELPGLLAEMNAALEQSDWAVLRRRAHHLKNSAIVVRDDALFGACSEAEEAAVREDADAARVACARCARKAERWTAKPKNLRPQSRPLQPEPST